MCAYNDVLLGSQVADLDILVGACRDDFCSILEELGLAAILNRILGLLSYLGKITVQYGLAVLVSVAALALAVGCDLIDADLVIPTGNGKKVRTIWRRRESEVGDGVGGGIGERNIVLEIADSVAYRCRARRASKKCRHGDIKGERKMKGWETSRWLFFLCFRSNKVLEFQKRK